MLDRLTFVLGEGLAAIRRNGFMAFAAMSTIAISLFMLGGLGYLYRCVDQYSKTLPGKFEMRVFLKDGVKFDDIHNTAVAIRAIPGVADAAHIPRDKAWAREKKEHPDLTEGIENPFPDQFKVTLKDLKRGDSVADAIREIPTVQPEEGVQYLKKEQAIVDQSLGFLRWLSSLGFLLFVTAGILIYNAIRLAVMSRRLEMAIMRLVGASRFTVQAPFVLEGIFHGVVGGSAAAGLIYLAANLITKRLHEVDPSLSIARFPSTAMFVILTGTGCLYGIVCSLVAVRMPMKSQ